MSISNVLGPQKEARLDAGVIRYRECGRGEPILFVHGLLMNGDLWRKVVPALSKSFRCITPDWPMGSHEVGLRPDADLTPSGQAKIVADFLAALDLKDVTLVGNDSGGAVSQIVVTEHPKRIGRLVLATCDAFEIFPPPFFNYILWSARVPGAIYLLSQTLRFRSLRSLPIAYGWIAKRPIDHAVTDAWTTPARVDSAVRRDLVKFLKGASNEYTIAAGKKLAQFDRPVLLAWAKDDRFFPLSLAERLAGEFPNARLVPVEDSYTLVPEDQPERLAELVTAFMREPAARRATAS